MKLSLDDLENYGENLNAIANEAASVFKQQERQYIGEIIDRYGDPEYWGKDLTDQVRAYTVDLMMENWTVYGDASSSIGSLFFEETLGDDMPEKAVMLDHTSPERCEQSARYWMKNLFGGNRDVDKFIDGCSSFVERNVSHAADLAVLDGSLALGEEGKRIKFGRVPVGPTCGFCIMLASRGFVYASKKSAGDEGGAFNRFHDYCNCRVVAGYEGLEVEGYDYQGMYERYLQCRQAIGDYEQVQKDWDALTPEERDEYGRGERAIPLSEDPKKDAELRKQLGNQANGFNDYLAHRIVQEMDTRDREWLYSGAVPIVDTSAICVAKLNDDQKRAYDKELGCAHVLANNGFRTALTDNPLEKHIPANPKFDYAIGNAGVSWEAKCPEGNGYLAVAGNIAKADAKFRKIGKESRIVMSNLDSTMSDKQFLDYFTESLEDPESDYSNVREILFVFKDGTVKRWVQ